MNIILVAIIGFIITKICTDVFYSCGRTSGYVDALIDMKLANDIEAAIKIMEVNMKKKSEK